MHAKCDKDYLRVRFPLAGRLACLVGRAAFPFEAAEMAAWAAANRAMGTRYGEQLT